MTHICICGKEFNSKSGLWYHKNKCEKINKTKEPHLCPHCDYSTLGPKITLKHHVLSKHTPENERPFQCTHCVRGFAQKSHLNCHIIKIHGGEIVAVKKNKIIKYEIEILDKLPKYKKTKIRYEFYKQNQTIYTRDLEEMNFVSRQLYYDAEKGYIKLTPITD
jgi:hypothetical protein